MMSTARPRKRVAIAAGIGLVLLPKCPLCIAAYLMSLGVGAEVASTAAPLLRPIAAIAIAAAVIAMIATLLRARRRRPAVCCDYAACRSTTENARDAQSACSPTGVMYDSTSAAAARPTVRTRIHVAR